MADNKIKLSGVEYERYRHKMELVGGIDPYSLDLKSMSKDPSKLPPVEDSDIQWYFVHTKSAYTYKEYKAQKALESHNQVTAGWVSDVCSHEAGDNVIVRGKVCIIIYIFISYRLPWLYGTPSEGGFHDLFRFDCYATIQELHE